MKQDSRSMLEESLKQRSDEFIRHPQFGIAKRAYIKNVLGLYEDNVFMTRLLIEAGRSVIFFHLLCFDAAHEPDDRTTWPTKALLAEAVRPYGVSSARRLDDIVGRLIASGYLESRRIAADRRVRILAPTERMVSHDLDWLVAQLSPLPTLSPSLDLDRPMRRDREYRRAVRKIGRDWFWYSAKLMGHNPHAMFFMLREAGMLVLMKLIEATDADPRGLAASVSLTDFARRFGISRTHVRDLLSDAESAGLLRRSREGVALANPLTSAFDLFVADVSAGHEEMHRQTLRALA